MLVKAPERADHIKNLVEAFSLLQKYNIKSPATTKEIQSLTGRAAALNRFLSRSTNKKDSKPIPGEDLYIYLAVSDNCQLSPHPRRTEGTTFGILHLKSSPQCKDSISENGKAHFSACCVCEKTKALLSSIPDNCHDIISFEIDPPQPRRFSSTHEMGYRTQSIRPPLPGEGCYKSPRFSRFCCRVYSDSRRREDGHEKQGKSIRHLPTDSNQTNNMWQLHVDKASNHKGAGAGVFIITPHETLLEQAITLSFSASNNEAEYEALLAGLRLAKELSIKRLAIYSNSQLITNQASDEYMTKHPRMVQYLDKVQGLLKEFLSFTIQQVPRAENTHADALASLGSALDTQFRRSILVEHLDRPSIEEIEPIDSMQIDEDPS
ncbi:unnamed protein product [Prunus armeniaca]